MAAEDTFDLYITFAGLCMLVDDDKKKRLHVLLPRTDKHEHEAKLLFNPGFKLGETGDLNHDKTPTSVDLKHRKLDLSTLVSPDPLKPNFPQCDVLDLGRVTGKTVARNLLDKGDASTAPGDSVTRVTLASGKATMRKRGAKWTIGADPADYMATSVEWRIRSLKGTSLTLNLEPLDKSGSSEGPIHLRVVDGEIRIWIYHVLNEDLPEKVPPLARPCRKPDGGVAHHVVELYKLLGTEGKAPVFDSCGDCGMNHEMPPNVRRKAKEAFSQEPADSPTRGEAAGGGGPAAGGKGAQASVEHVDAGEHSSHAAGGASTMLEFSGDEVACIAVSAKAAAS